jgi:alanine racemase
MSRSGMDDAHFDRAVAHALQSRYVRLAGVSSHFAAADDDADFTDHQFARFEAALQRHQSNLPGDCIAHIANTFATFRDSRYHLSMVRVGLGLYGFGGAGLQPITRWQTRIIHKRSFPKGATVGYNQTATLKRDSVIGVVPVGYGDGYALALGNRAMVELPDQQNHAPIVGKVNMDQITIDLTDAPAAQIGSLVNVYSDDPRSPAAVDRLAQVADEHCYAMLTRIGARIERQYVR